MEDATHELAISEQTQNIEILQKTHRTSKTDIRHYWDRDEINRRLDKVTNYKHKILLIFLWMSGVRITEAIGLRKMDLDLKAYLMRVRWLKSRFYKDRMIPIHPRLKDILEVYTATLKAEDKVFPYSRQRAWQIVQQWMDGHPHQFRHSFARNWLLCGGDIVVLHKILGHSRIQTTMEYLKIVPVDQGKELIKIIF